MDNIQKGAYSFEQLEMAATRGNQYRSKERHRILPTATMINRAAGTIGEEYFLKYLGEIKVAAAALDRRAKALIIDT